jgi:hypothetical protein
MITAEFNAIIDNLGAPGSHEMAKAPGTITPITKIAMQSIGRSEESLVNAYGVDGRRIHIKASSLPIPPEKFDVFIIGTQRHAVADVQPKLEAGTGLIMGYQCFCKGTA